MAMITKRMGEMNPINTERFEAHENWDKGFQAALDLPELKALEEAASKLGLQCVNTGNYGSLGLSPGECRCSTCSMRIALKSWREFKNDSNG